MRLTARGWTVLVGGVAWCVLALIIGQRDLWWPGAFLVLLPLASWLVLRPGSGELTVTRRISPQQVSVGQSAQVDLHLDAATVGLGGVSRVRDRVPAALGDARWYGFARNLGRSQPSVTYTVHATRRGRHHLGPLERSMTDSLGLASVSKVVPGTDDLLVTPRVEQLTDRHGASGLGLASDTTQPRSGLGRSDDVLVREYQQGDDRRRIHWRSSAHSGRLMVRREETAWDPSAVVIIDNRAHGYSTHAWDDRLEWAISAVASISLHLLADGFDVTLVAADGSVIGPRRFGAQHSQVILEHLAELGTQEIAGIAGALNTCRRGPEGQLIVAVLGRVDEADAAAMAEVSRHGRTCRAILLASSVHADDHQAAAVRAAGWQCVTARPVTPVSTVWQQLGREGAR